MPQSINHSVKAECQKMIIQRSTALANNTIPDWASYKFNTGQIAALKAVIAFVESKIGENHDE